MYTPPYFLVRSYVRIIDPRGREPDTFYEPAIQLVQAIDRPEAMAVYESWVRKLSNVEGIHQFENYLQFDQCLTVDRM